MTKKNLDLLLGSLERTQPMFYSHGTPVLAENDEAVRQLVEMGAEIVPDLVRRIQGDIPKATAAYAAMVLGRLGDVRAVGPLSNLRDRYQTREPKDEWDFAVIGQCNIALSRLEKESPQTAIR